MQARSASLDGPTSVMQDGSVDVLSTDGGD